MRRKKLDLELRATLENFREKTTKEKQKYQREKTF